MMRRIESREDYQVCEKLCHLISCDSYLEALYLLVLLTGGAEPALVRPLEFGQPPNPIVSPDLFVQVGHRLHPCLKHEGAYHFFQISFQAESLLRVDVLKWDDEWSVIEINGLGHDDSTDSSRAARLHLPVQWLSEKDIIARAEAALYKTAEKRAS